MTIFIKVTNVDTDEKAAHLLSAITHSDATANYPLRELSGFQLSQLPGSPFAYWVEEAVRKLFLANDSFESKSRTAKVGVNTSADFRFVRSWWEPLIVDDAEKWVPFAKGGAYSPYFKDIPDLIKWDDDAHELKTFAESTSGTTHWSRRLSGWEYYFKPGLSWPLRARSFGTYPLPEGCVFSVRSYCAFVPTDDLMYTMALFNSSVFDYLFKTTLGRNDYPEFIVGVLQRLPWPAATKDQRDSMAASAAELWSLRRSRDEVVETSHAFILPIIALKARKDIGIKEIEARSKILQDRIDDEALKLFGITLDDCASMDNGAVASDGEESSDERAEEATHDADQASALFSWCVGVAFGRFDIRLATGERPLPDTPKPFDPVPMRSPGMTCTGSPPLFMTSSVLVDDAGHKNDITAMVRSVLEQIGTLSGVDTSTTRIQRWQRREFWPQHISFYSKRGRKAPIYWQISTTSGSYSLWIYTQSCTTDTLHRIRQDYVVPKLAHEQRQLNMLIADAGTSPSLPHRKQIEACQALIVEIRSLDDELVRVAPLWQPEFDDGILLTFSPFWRLFSHNRSWQKELRSVWIALCDGKYDWSHLAMRLWPERVVPKCSTDRSLSIAHGLEKVFWFKNSAGKHEAYRQPCVPIQKMIEERTAPAVKDALQSLLNASNTSAPQRTRRLKSD